MKKNNLLQLFSMSFIIAFVLLLSTLSAKELAFRSNQDVVNNALSIIKEKPGKIASIQTRYKMTKDNKAISVETKFYFSKYRKKPQSVYESFDVKDASVSKVIEVIYNPKQDRKHIIFLEGKPGEAKKKRSKKRIAINP